MKELFQIIEVIDNALLELDILSNQYKMYQKGKEPYDSTHRILILLRSEININQKNINKRVLRAIHDMGMSSYKDFENTKLECLINSIISIIYNQIPIYKSLEPLREDFGKGNPI
ncbi:hypothetical protein [Flavobacterium sp. UBA4197]|uniref:hypothetical protein n=1 Tax=Flavobacterium sp. UBA4197 TaxID=1946546 RepID=UPI002580C64B|nr:hypothetical protein [Flavobacterium sp. UBA4197]